MSKEISIKHDEIQDPQTITGIVENKFKEYGLDIHRHEVEDLQDDFKKGIRKLKIKNTKYYAIGRVPWHEPTPEMEGSEKTQKPTPEMAGKKEI